MSYIVYKITNKINNMIYIGVTSQDITTYNGSGSRLLADYKIFDKSDFIKEILYEYDNKDDMLNKEKELVNDEFIKRDDTYNIILGGGDLNTKGFVSIIGEDGIGKLIEQNLYNNHKTFTTDKVTVVCSDSISGYKSISKDEFNTGNYTGCVKDLVRIKDVDSETGYSTIHKSKFNKKIHKSWNDNMTSAILLSTGESIHVSKDDIRWSNGEIAGVNINRKRYYKPNSNLPSKIINKDDIKQYENDGWVPGSGMIWLRKDLLKKMVQHYEIKTYINNGWEKVA